MSDTDTIFGPARAAILSGLIDLDDEPAVIVLVDQAPTMLEQSIADLAGQIGDRGTSTWMVSVGSPAQASLATAPTLDPQDGTPGTAVGWVACTVGDDDLESQPIRWWPIDPTTDPVPTTLRALVTLSRSVSLDDMVTGTPADGDVPVRQPDGTWAPAPGAGGGPTPSDALPLAAGAAAAGSSPDVSRSDHVHPAPPAARVLGGSWTANGLAETVPPWAGIANQSVLTSGRLAIVPLWLTAGTVVSSISFVSGTAAASNPTHQWFGLFRWVTATSVEALGLTVDDLTAAWGTSTRKTLALPAPVTITASGVYGLGIMVAADVVPSLRAVNQSTGVGYDFTSRNATGAGVGLTGPPALPWSTAAATGLGSFPYGFVA